MAAVTRAGAAPSIVFIPCETFPVTVTMGPSEIPTPLERLVLKAIHSGADSIDLLNTLFALGPRPTLRLILDLLNRAYVIVNFETGEVRLTPQTAAAVAENMFEKLESGDRTQKEIMLMRDLVAGCVLSIRPQPRVSTGSRISPLLPPNAVADLPLDKVHQTVRRQWRGQKTHAGRPMRVLETSLGGSERGGQLRDMELEVRVSFDEAGDTLRLAIEAPDSLPWDVRRRLERKLTQLANEEPPQTVFKNLRASAARDARAGADRSIRSQLAALDALVDQLGSVPRGTEAVWQSKLRDRAEQLEAALQLQTPGVSHEVLASAGPQLNAIRDLIRTAERQIVLACPFIAYDGLSLYRSDIERALGLGRRLFLLLGMDDTFRLPTGVRSILDQWCTAYPDQVFVSEKSARCHAKFAAVDGRAFVLTSYNFLNAVPGPVFELGVLVRAPARMPGASAECEQVTELLSIAREIFPEPIGAQLMATSLSNAVIAPAHGPRHTIPNVAFEETAADGVESHRTQLWNLRWQRYRSAASKSVAVLGTPSRIVRDAEHRQLLYDAVRTASARLLVVSDQLHSRVVTRQFVTALRECLSRGVKVVLIARRPEPAALDVLRNLAAEGKGQLTVLASSQAEEQLESHAKVLVCDDWVVVTSFNFLSFSGDYEGADRYSLRTEVGLLLEGAPSVESILSALSTAVPQALTVADLVPPVEVDAPDDAAIDVNIRDVEGLFENLRQAKARLQDANQLSLDRAESQLIGAWFADAASPSVAFAELEQLSLIEASFIEKAIAACLHLWPDDDDARRGRWVEDLIERLWWQRRDPSMTFALLLSAGPPTRAAIPPIEIAQLAALCREECAGVGDFDTAALFASDSPTVDAALSVWALALQPLLYAADPPIDGLLVAAEKLDAPSRALADAAVAFRGHYPLGLAAVDFGAVATVGMVEARAAEARQALCRELQRCVAYTSDLGIGTALWLYIVGGPTGLQRMLDAANSGNVMIVRDLLAIYMRKGVEGMLDEAVKEGGRRLAPAQRKFYGDRRRRCAGYLHKVITHAKAWTTQAVSASDSAIAPESVVALAAIVERERESLLAAFTMVAAQRRYPAPLLDAVTAKVLSIVRFT